ncbi:signal peptidase II [Amycolatopsis minnesotensis]|uniref:Lipoprotein signal peptidase n=1 Tax=Amycolatopsis minnesotensis TaxID=337894 RepID=A0ABN2RL77_9PSEU
MAEPEPSSPATTPSPRRWGVAVAVAVLILAADQLTKLWAESALTDRAPIPVLGEFLRFRLLYNSGAAFSIGAGSTWIFTVLAAVAVVAVAWFAAKVVSPGWAVALGLLLGGALTHLLDRLFRAPGFGRGHVVDFIDYNGWFVGNVADIALTVGAVCIVVLTMRGTEMDGRRRPAASRNDDPPAGR